MPVYVLGCTIIVYHIYHAVHVALKGYLLLRLVVSVRSFVRSCVRMKNGNGSGSRMCVLPDEPSNADVMN